MLAVLGLLLSLAACQVTQPGRATPTAEELAAWEQRRLAKSGFEPLASLAGRGLEVQRIDPMWGLLDHPSVELTRDRAGTVTIALRFWGHERTQVVTPEVWDRLAAGAPGAFSPVDPKAWRKRDRQVIRQSGYCHSWHELEAFIAGQTWRTTASPCMAEIQKASLAYADELARIAIDNIALCEPDRPAVDVQKALQACGARFGPPTETYRWLLD